MHGPRYFDQAPHVSNPTFISPPKVSIRRSFGQRLPRILRCSAAEAADGRKGGGISREDLHGGLSDIVRGIAGPSTGRETAAGRQERDNSGAAGRRLFGVRRHRWKRYATGFEALRWISAQLLPPASDARLLSSCTVEAFLDIKYSSNPRGSSYKSCSLSGRERSWPPWRD
ncbi:hypothetical protein KM043_008624 [Ampulex compressa]|nr:hypothetical protein KM043_008624 [Ampulex compressa]